MFPVASGAGAVSARVRFVPILLQHYFPAFIAPFTRSVVKPAGTVPVIAN